MRNLVVVGAATGMGRWLARHLFASHPWERVTLVDASRAVLRLEVPFAGPVTTATLDDLDGAGLGDAPAAVCLAVEHGELAATAAAVVPHLHPESVVFDISSSKVEAAEILAEHAGGRATFGIHPLFGPAAPSLDGQTIVVCPSPTAPDAHAWLVDLVEAEGGIVQVSDPHAHDRMMGYVQAASHQALLHFATVIAQSGLDIEDDLWRYRTPVFETLLGLASRVLSPGQESATADIQMAKDGARIADEFERATAALGAAIRSHDPTAIEAHIRTTRDAFGGTFFTTVQQTSNLAVGATQLTRTQLASQRRAGEIIAIEHRKGGATRLAVGRIVELTPTTVHLEELLVGSEGRAALLVGPGIANAARLGVSPKRTSKVVQFGLAHVNLLSPADTDRALDAWLGRLPIDVRLLVPESIAGEAVVTVCATVAMVDGASLVSEIVRLGQREVITRLQVRADRDLRVVADAVAELIEDVYAWPKGIAAPLTRPASAIAYLGPAGTFSETAAHRAVDVLGAAGADLRPFPTMADVVGAVAGGEVDVAVLPITNSSSGLVAPAAAELARAGDLAAGGVIDVPVRFDAYAAPDHEQLGPGTRVLSHPQGLAQCARYVQRRGWVPEPCDSTIAACAAAAADPTVAALAPSGRELDGIVTVERDVGDLSGVLTRFLLVGRGGTFGDDVADAHVARDLWLVEDDGARFEERIVGTMGRALVVTTGAGDAQPAGGVFLGRIPWSPRTPIVRV
ncbi:MAG TPA: prephenate dehydrogenase/arogenate dehydrogenase family protein [Acidimicrobiales bacterium]|nr:prephenate dehydrogenase/arogenate dehydrogenase family protein [Acidimicrobiales bacterium]